MMHQGVNCWKEIGIFGDSSCPKLSELVHCRNCPEYNRVGRGLLDRAIADEFLDEWTKTLAGAKEIDVRDTFSAIVFRINNEWLALKTIYLQETTHVRPVHDVPFRTNKVFRGLVNINGELLLCVSIAELMESTPEDEIAQTDEKAYRRMLVISRGSERYAFPVDEVQGIYRLSSGDIQDPPATITRSPERIIEGIFNLSGKKVGLMGEERLIEALKRSLGS
ncbi:MAG: hypothetical protein C4530_19520 [Desulfobacteraceae bacterium]|nr:MAG: hypothetical protein C4530_19520 [Desulfobacteraceae bacterium]